MAISYLPLWFNFSQKGISKTELGNLIRISSATLAKLIKNEYINLGVIDKICEKFDYSIEKVTKYIAQKNNSINSLELNCFYEAKQPLRNNQTTIMNILLLKKVKQLNEPPLYLIAPFIPGRKQSVIIDSYITPKQISFFDIDSCICFSKIKMIPYESIKKLVFSYIT